MFVPVQIRGIIGRFQELDADGSGFITRDEAMAQSKKNV